MSSVKTLSVHNSWSATLQNVREVLYQTNMMAQNFNKINRVLVSDESMCFPVRVVLLDLGYTDFETIVEPVECESSIHSIKMEGTISDWETL